MQKGYNSYSSLARKQALSIVGCASVAASSSAASLDGCVLSSTRMRSACCAGVLSRRRRRADQPTGDRALLTKLERGRQAGDEARLFDGERMERNAV